ncbi:MAG: glycosyl transferase [Adhaeribacter sp.]|jgi:penicillin-binding protein 1C|nr:glycosyl transferase [Adhaeribacter sp.]
MQRDNIAAFKSVFARFRRPAKKGTRWVSMGLVLFLCCGLTLALLNYIFPLRINITYSPVIMAADGSVINAFLSRDDKWRMQLEPGEINPVLEKALLLKEDKYFYYHPGVNPVALGRALVKILPKTKRPPAPLPLPCR